MKSSALLLALITLVLFNVPKTFAADAFDERPVPVKTPPPTYPGDMQKDGISGLVAVRVTIDESGNVVECTVSKSSHPQFEEPALDAVRKWKFRPATKDGSPVKARMIIPIKFSVSE